MCGIVGAFQFHGPPQPDVSRLVQAARDRLAHRGPDDAGLYVSPDETCVMGSRRLSIVDHSAAANQPMSNEDKTLWLVFNGEIHNHRQLRKSLAERGHRFRSACDTEVIVHLYEEHDTELLAHLDGIFSFVLYDARRRRLFGARDRLGVKPLYYSLSTSRFAFASEPKALLRLPGVSREPRIEEVPSYLTFDCVPGPRTLFRDIDKLEPGTLFEVASDGFRKRRFWCPAGNGVDHTRHAGNPSSVLADSLSEAVAKRLATEVPSGATLSGGIDSSLVVALMTEALGSKVNTFTVGYPADQANPTSDLYFARSVARRFDTNHHELIITDKDLLTLLEEDLPELADDPIGSPSQTGIVHLAKYASRGGVKVIQVGEGSDEIFCGYPNAQQLWRFHQRFSHLSRLLPRRLAGLLAQVFRRRLEGIAINVTKIGSMDGTLLEHVRRFANNEHNYWGYGICFCGQDHERLYGKALPPGANPYERLRARLADLPDFDKRPYLDQLAIIDLMLELPERLLMRIDKGMMRYGVEAREPFLDANVLKAAFQIPPDLRAADQKAVLKAYARDKLPAEILMRQKAGFPADSEIFTAPSVLPKIRESILSKRFLAFTGFDPSRLREYIAAREAGREYSEYFPHIWTIYILSLWFHRWVEGTH